MRHALPYRGWNKTKQTKATKGGPEAMLHGGGRMVAMPQWFWTVDRAVDFGVKGNISNGKVCCVLMGPEP